MGATSAGSRAVRLIVVRHGPAEEIDPLRWPDDDRRPLTAEGRAELKRALRGLAGLLEPIDLVASSPADRATATAELLREAVSPTPRIDTWPELAPGNSAQPILGRLSRVARPGTELVVVGHAPTLSELVGLALSGDEVPFVRLARGGAACLEFDSDVRPAAGTLSWLLTRKQLSDVRR